MEHLKKTGVQILRLDEFHVLHHDGTAESNIAYIATQYSLDHRTDLGYFTRAHCSLRLPEDNESCYEWIR